MESRVMNTKSKRKEKTKKTEEIKMKTLSTKKSKISSIIISIIVAFIIGYIIFDFFVLKKRIENEVTIVNEKFDNLQMYLDEKIPMIDNAIEVQRQQVEELQQMDFSLNKD